MLVTTFSGRRVAREMTVRPCIQNDTFSKCWTTQQVQYDFCQFNAAT